jgi:hypothetical protein
MPAENAALAGAAIQISNGAAFVERSPAVHLNNHHSV